MKRSSHRLLNNSPNTLIKLQVPVKKPPFSLELQHYTIPSSYKSNNMSIHITRLFRLKPFRASHLQQLPRRNGIHDASKPFPPPQPTRPIHDVQENGSSNDNSSSGTMSSTLDAVAEDTLSVKDPNSFKRSHHFDTYEVLTHLESQGFTRRQAEVIMKGMKFRLREW